MTIEGVLRRIRQLSGIGYVRDREPLRIDDLISPLRYDILVRQHYFSFLHEHRDTVETDFEGLVEASRSHHYFTWYSRVVVPRFRPDLIGDAAGIDCAFERRIAAAVALLRSFEAHGFDRRQPITLLTGRSIEPTITGKRLARRVYAGDGCHRLALLRAQGVTMLEPELYRLRRQRSLQPLDNTAILLRALAIDRSTYRDFLALSYDALVGWDAGDGDGPTAAADRERLAEMRQIAALDAPLVVDASGRRD